MLGRELSLQIKLMLSRRLFCISNDILDKDAELDESTLPRVKMPNRNGFVPDPRHEVHNKPDQ